MTAILQGVPEKSSKSSCLARERPPAVPRPRVTKSFPDPPPRCFVGPCTDKSRLVGSGWSMSACPQKQTFVSALSMSALCHKRTWAWPHLLAHLIADDRLRFPNSLPFALQWRARAFIALAMAFSRSLAFRVLLQFRLVVRRALATDCPLFFRHHASPRLCTLNAAIESSL